MKSIVLILFFSLSIFHYCLCQITIGPEIGHYADNFIGSHKIDSLVINSANGVDVGEPNFGIFAEVRLTKLIDVNVKFQFRDLLIPYEIYNDDDKIYGFTVRKTKITSTKNYSVQVLPQLTLPLLKTIETKLFLGPIINFNKINKSEDIQFRNGTRHQGVAEVFNSVDDTILPTTVTLVVGGSLSYKNIVVSMSMHQRYR
ncbi:MAG: hypothetical protein ACOCXH_12295, partial [Cyclobacteriaceae bacterium]